VAEFESSFTKCDNIEFKTSATSYIEAYIVVLTIGINGSLNRWGGTHVRNQSKIMG